MFSSPVSDKNNVYKVELLNIFGNIHTKEINLKDLTKSNAFQHPFSNFKYDDRYYYLATQQINNAVEQERFEKKLNVE